jgi:RNA polymerase sigma-70 factor (ECF subfamily)
MGSGCDNTSYGEPCSDGPHVATALAIGLSVSVHDQKPFAEQFVRSQHRVYGYVVTLLPNRDDADDAFQETCLILWDKWMEFDPTRDFTRWACGIAYNVARNYRRGKHRTEVTLSDQLLDGLAAERLTTGSLLDERRDALAGCLAKLTTTQRALIEQCYFGSQQMQAVADSQSLTRAALYLRLQRIRRILFECVNQSLQSGGDS